MEIIRIPNNTATKQKASRLKRKYELSGFKVKILEDGPVSTAAHKFLSSQYDVLIEVVRS